MPDERPVRLRPVAERDAALREHLETTHFYDERTGDMWDPPALPADPDEDEDRPDVETPVETAARSRTQQAPRPGDAGV